MTSIKKTLFVASTGGHLSQLVKLSNLYPHTQDSLWVTFDTPQSRSLLEGRRVLYIPYIKPRDIRNTLRGMRLINKVLRQEEFDFVISTGAGIALSAFPVAKVKKIKTRYIESVSRTEGPSLTGRIVQRTKLAETWTQHTSWESSKWHKHQSVLGVYERYEKASPIPQDSPKKIFVTLGTIEGYSFSQLLESLIQTGLCDENTIWQLGNTPDPGNLPGEVYSLMSDADFTRAVADADIVVTHAGVGTILKLLDMGKYPVIVPRRQKRNEHVDDHQTQIATLINEEGLGIVTEAPDLTSEKLLSSLTHNTRKADHT